MWTAKWYRRWLKGSLQAFLFILLIEDHARLKGIFKYEIMKPDFKLADASLMREVELLQQSAAFLFGAGVVAGFTAGKPLTTQQQGCSQLLGPSIQDWKPPLIWVLWGIIAASLLLAVLSAFFARMMTSMLWSLAKDYLDRLDPVYDQMYDTNPQSAALTSVLEEWGKKMVKNQAKAPGRIRSNSCIRLEQQAACAKATAKPDPANEIARSSLAGAQQSKKSGATSAAAADGSSRGASDQGPAAASSGQDATAGSSAASSSAADAPVNSVSRAGNNKKSQVKQIIYWSALNPALIPGINTVWAFISLAKVLFLVAVTLWLLVFMLIAIVGGWWRSRWTVVACTSFAVVFMLVVMICMVRYVFCVYRRYHEPNGAFWPAKWETIFRFDVVPESNAGVAAMWNPVVHKKRAAAHLPPADRAEGGIAAMA